MLITYPYLQVQSGGSFDVDYTVTGPGDKIIMEDTKERQLDSVFTAKEEGEHRFCFNNEMSTFAEKMVDFEIAVGSAPCPSFTTAFQHLWSSLQHLDTSPDQANGIFS